MKGQGIELIKDFIISVLIVATIGIVISIVFYDKIALGKVIPEAEDYILSKEMQNELSNTKLDDAQEIIVNYYIDASDLKKYEKTNEYIKGKNNPFAAVDTSVEENNTTTGNNTSSNNITGNGGFYEDDGTK